METLKIVSKMQQSICTWLANWALAPLSQWLLLFFHVFDVIHGWQHPRKHLETRIEAQITIPFFLFNSQEAFIASLVKNVEMLNIKSITVLKNFTFLELQGEMKGCLLKFQSQTHQ